MSLPTIHEVRLYTIAGHHVPAILYGDTWAILPLVRKTTLLDARIVFFHPTDVWDDRLESADYGTKSSGYRGAVQDHRVAALVYELIDLSWYKNPHPFEEDPRYMGKFDEWPDLWGEEE